MCRNQNAYNIYVNSFVSLPLKVLVAISIHNITFTYEFFDLEFKGNDTHSQ